ncbi:hypothetical protein [Actinomadura harenae]|uniref:Uncharacterized protein n=1 Tax=Actinomadura harenae TaxID=2483351 RepID=A0A3M2LQY4_9ACTN|nr:hypothetical protein [Actinomadura harenae]RMI39891.1 hypothetical protein EBO15_28410 [Actinomadura harenae]RMI39895.1 hypothetical protein EBO15_28430 [Actinomadura harenae]
MSTIPCPISGCGRPTRGATICGACEADLERALTAVPWLVAQLDLVLSRQTRTGSSGGARSAETSLPYAPHASEASRVLASTLTAWVDELRPAEPRRIGPLCERCTHASCRLMRPLAGRTASACAVWLRARVDRIVRLPVAEELWDEITAAVWAAQRLVDRPPERRYVGQCGAGLDDGTDCDVDLYARPDAAAVTCPECGTRWDVRWRRRRLLEAAEDTLATAADLARALTGLGHEVTPEMIRGYGHRGQIVPHGRDGRGRPLYRLADVADAVAAAAARRAERSA